MKHAVATAAQCMSRWWIDVADKLTKKDREFLRAIGIAPEPLTGFADSGDCFTESQSSTDKQELRNLPKRAQLDLLTRVTLQRLLNAFEDNE
jgi:hypothetical protein